MSNWFCEYSRDGYLKYHVQFEAIDREDAIYQLENDYNLHDEEILDLHEIAS